MRTRSVLIALSFSLLTAACADDMAPGLEGEDDIDSDAISQADGFKADGLGSTATYYNIKRDTRRCAAPLCGGYFVSRVNRSWTKCHDGAWRNACYVAAADFGTGLSLSSDESNSLEADIANNLLVVRGNVKAGKFGTATLGRFMPTEAWRASSANAAKGTFYRVTDRGIVCITGPCPSLHEAMLNSTIASDIHGLSLDATGANELQVNQVWVDLDKGPVIFAGTNVTYKDPLSGRPGVRLDATQVFTAVKHLTLSGYAPTAREIGGRDFVNATGTAPVYPRSYHFDGTSFDVAIDDAVAPCPAGAACIWSGIVTQKATWSVVGQEIRLTYAGPTTNSWGIEYVRALSVKKDSDGNLVLAEIRNDGTATTQRLFR